MAGRASCDSLPPIAFRIIEQVTDVKPVWFAAADAIVAGLDFEAALQDPDMVKLQASQQVRTVVPAPRDAHAASSTGLNEAGGLCGTSQL